MMVARRAPLICTTPPPPQPLRRRCPSPPPTASSAVTIVPLSLVPLGGIPSSTSPDTRDRSASAVKDGVDGMIKYVANEPSVGLYFVQQHARASMPILLDVKVPPLSPFLQY